MKSVASILLFAFSLTISARTPGQQLTVAAAANVQYVMKDIQAGFESETGIKMNVILNSSGNLAAQIKEGAPYDVFVSADTDYPEQLFKTGMATTTPRVYAKGAVVLWTTRTDLDLSAGVKLLLSPDIRKIAIANPRLAPYGTAALQVIKEAGLFEKIKDKLVYAESISQANQYILSRSADIGFTAKSIIVSEKMKSVGTWIEVNPKTYHAIEQAAVILIHGARNNKTASEKFYRYLYSAKAAAIFKKYGYIIP